MCSVACRNHCQFHSSLYGSSNSVLLDFNTLNMNVIYIRSAVALSDLLVAGDVKSWYQS
jgi:hypothetical protein